MTAPSAEKAPAIKMGEKEPGEILAVDRVMSEEYLREEDQMVTMMELSMG